VTDLVYVKSVRNRQQDAMILSWSYILVYLGDISANEEYSSVVNRC